MLRGLRRHVSLRRGGRAEYMRYLHSETAAQDGKTGLWRTEGAVLTRDGKKAPVGGFLEGCTVIEEIMGSTSCGGTSGTPWSRRSCRCDILASSRTKGSGVGGLNSASVERAVAARFDSSRVSLVADDATVVPGGLRDSSTVPDTGGSGIGATWSCPSQASFASKREL